MLFEKLDICYKKEFENTGYVNLNLSVNYLNEKTLINSECKSIFTSFYDVCKSCFIENEIILEYVLAVREVMEMQICERLKEARKNTGMTQEEVAERVLVSRVTISSWENGKTLPDIASLISLSDLYNISLDELVKGDSKMTEKIKKDAKDLSVHY